MCMSHNILNNTVVQRRNQPPYTIIMSASQFEDSTMLFFEVKKHVCG